MYALEAIPGDRLPAIRDVLLNPSASKPYDELKAAILNFYTPTREERLRQLLSGHPAGDTTPSRHLAQLKSLAGPSNANSDIVQELWLRSLPRHVQPTVMALLEDSTSERAAMIADKIVARVGNEHSLLVATTSQPSAQENQGRHVVRPQQPRPYCIHQRLSFKDRIPCPKNIPSVAKPRQERAARPAHVRQAPSKRELSKSSNDPREGYCWFHRCYGPSARRCRQPCTYVTGNASADE